MDLFKFGRALNASGLKFNLVGHLEFGLPFLNFGSAILDSNLYIVLCGSIMQWVQISLLFSVICTGRPFRILSYIYFYLLLSVILNFGKRCQSAYKK